MYIISSLLSTSCAHTCTVPYLHVLDLDLRSRYKKGTQINVDVDMTTYIESYILSSFSPEPPSGEDILTLDNDLLAEDFCVLLGQGLAGMDIDDTAWTGQRNENVGIVSDCSHGLKALHGPAELVHHPAGIERYQIALPVRGKVDVGVPHVGGAAIAHRSAEVFAGS